MELALDDAEDDFRRGFLGLPFPTWMALVVLLLSLFYAVGFSGLVYFSLLEEHSARHALEAGIHVHNPIEWALLYGPALLGWLGVLASLNYLARHRLR